MHKLQYCCLDQELVQDASIHLQAELSPWLHVMMTVTPFLFLFAFSFALQALCQTLIQALTLNKPQPRLVKFGVV